jgi:hypothetical protein
MKTMALSLRLALLAVWMAIPMGAVGCAAVLPHLPTVIAAVTDGLMVLDAIESFIDRYFKRNLDADKEAKVRTAISKTRSALNVALRTGQGAEKLNQAQIDEAFKDFKLAYQELLALAGPIGVTSGDALSARPGGVVVPEPLALTLKAR